MTLWVEDYRPRRVVDLVLPESIRRELEVMVTAGEVPNLIFHGMQGTGKTSAAKTLCHEMDLDVITINASDESGIDVLRHKIRDFATTMSLNGRVKVVILDEADHLNPSSTQPALRHFMEEFAEGSRFILTANFPRKIIEPLHSRCVELDFTPPRKELPRIASVFLEKLVSILENERIEFQQDVLVRLILMFAPDWRKVLNECQRYANHGGKIDVGILSSTGEEKLLELREMLREKRFRDMRAWVVENVSSIDSTRFYRDVYDSLYELFDKSFIPDAVLMIDDYMYRDAFVMDREIHVVAFLTELMSRGRFRN